MKKLSSTPTYGNWKREKIQLTDLFLDQENIRLQIDVKSSQEALINDLFFNENAMEILKSIVNSGFFPDEIPVVIKEDKKIIVIEGNS